MHKNYRKYFFHTIKCKGMSLNVGMKEMDMYYRARCYTQCCLEITRAMFMFKHLCSQK